MLCWDLCELLLLLLFLPTAVFFFFGSRCMKIFRFSGLVRGGGEVTWWRVGSFGWWWGCISWGGGGDGVCRSSFTKVVNRLGGAETHTAGFRCHLYRQPHPKKKKEKRFDALLLLRLLLFLLYPHVLSLPFFFRGGGAFLSSFFLSTFDFEIPFQMF